MANALQVIRVHTQVEFTEAHALGSQAKTLDEVVTDLDRQARRIHLPQALRGAFQHQLQNPLRLMPLDVAGLQLLTGLLNGPGPADQFSYLAGRRAGMVITLAEPAHHADDT